MKKLAALILLLLVAPAWAEWPYDAVCAICLPAGNGPQCGSGTMVGINGDECVVASANHVFEGGNTRSIKCRFLAVSDEWQPMKLVYRGRNDLAVLTTKTPPGIKTPRSVRPARKEDGPFVAAGYPGYSRTEIRFNSKPAHFIQYWENDGDLHLTGTVDGGMSGGGIFNKHGDFVGTISGNSKKPGAKEWTEIWGASGKALSDVLGRYVEVTK